MADNAEIGDGDGNCEDKMDKRSPSKNSNRDMSYLTTNAKKTSVQLKQSFTKAFIF